MHLFSVTWLTGTDRLLCVLHSTNAEVTVFALKGVNRRSNGFFGKHLGRLF